MFPEKIYDIRADWDENLRHGPYGDYTASLPERNPMRFTFLGHGLNSLFGIPACPLTADPRYAGVHSRLGYDVLTYKSERSIKWGGNSSPHWRYVDVPNGVDISQQASVVARDTPFTGQEVSMANSFGVHSKESEIWIKEFEDAKKLLLPGQLLILSVMPSHIPGVTLVDDGRTLARFATQTSADIVEVNFACPNTDGGKGLIYEDLELTVQICKAMNKILDGRKLLVKVGFFKDQENIKKFMEQTRGVIAGISSMNTFSAKVVSSDGAEVFPGRASAGISGAAIRKMAMEQARNIVSFKKELNLPDFVVIGIGGVTTVEHIQQYLDLGVDAVQSAVGAYEDPLLASKYLQTL